VHGRWHAACKTAAAHIALYLMKRLLYFGYGVGAYLIGFATLMYNIAFIGNFAVPTKLDGPASGPLWQTASINLALITIFGLQHSVMARPGFKRWWKRWVPEEIERSTYVLCASIALLLLMLCWQPMGGTLWHVSNPLGRALLYALFGIGWVIVLTSTYLINHFDLFGLRQVWLQLREREYTPLTFGAPLFYRFVRHPLYAGFLLAFWAAPTMTAAHLLFAVATTAYILIAIRFEERDLIAAHPEYAGYRERVPMLIPRVSAPELRTATTHPSHP
jgi:protein-S-isoprenylcysteine O-methyltransferase Ste14